MLPPTPICDPEMQMGFVSRVSKMTFEVFLQEPMPVLYGGKSFVSIVLTKLRLALIGVDEY
jgi:hypothetical protein